MRASATAVVLCAALALVGFSAPRSSSAAGCTFELGFKDLHDQIPDIVGDCLANADPQPDGDVQQPSVNGLLVWRKADNWTAFTNGATTWINGPCGLQDRPNDEQFAWEAGGSCSEQAQADEFQQQIAMLAGSWQRRDASLVVSQDGSAVFAWEGRLCDEVPRPCQRRVANGAVKARAFITLSDVELGSVPRFMGQVTGFTATLFHVGPIAVLRPTADLVIVEQTGGATVSLCRPPREPNFCQ